MHERPTEQDSHILHQGLAGLPEPVARPVLIVVSGLPGSGKSFFGHRLAERFPVAILETDDLRQKLVPTPTHSAEESQRLFAAVHLLIERLLSRGIPVLLDATNLVERHREILYHLAEKAGAKLILVRIGAPPDVVVQRLQTRQQQAAREDHSTADVRVYQRMQSSAEPIRRQHYAVDTSRDIGPAIANVLREVRSWLRG